MDFAEANHALTRRSLAERGAAGDADAVAAPNDRTSAAGGGQRTSSSGTAANATRPVEVEFRRAMRTALMPRSASANGVRRRRRSSVQGVGASGRGTTSPPDLGGGDQTPTRRGSSSFRRSPPRAGATTAASEDPSFAQTQQAPGDDDVPIFRFGAPSPWNPGRRRRDSQGADSFDRFRSALDVLADPAYDDPSSSWAATRTAALARPVPTKPSRILDAPDIVDDYYLNLLSWSSTNVLAVALANNVYLWNAATNEVSELLQLEQGDCVTSVAWAPGGQHLGVGTDSHVVQLWDTTRMQLVRAMRGHAARVGSLAWNPVSRCVTSGSRDALILQHDARAQRHRVATMRGHQQEVCGLAWSADGSTLASGGNENYLCLWDAARSGVQGGQQRETTDAGTVVAPRVVLRHHQAAVKALAWCPSHRNLLASGGGTADRTIKFWNAHTGALLNSVDTGSQVCALLWSRHTKEIVSSHGFSQNQLCLWRYPSMTKLCELTGHTARVLHLAQSPDGETVVSAAADETLRFWNIFGPSAGGPPGASRKSPGSAGKDPTFNSPSNKLGGLDNWRHGGDGLSIR